MPFKRIVSLVPSLTELLVDLGVSEFLVGRTRFCIHPDKLVQSIEIIGGTKNPNLDKIRALSPDLVIANKEENRKEDIKTIQGFSEVIITDISTIEDTLFVIRHLAEKLEIVQKGNVLMEKILSILPEKDQYTDISTAYFVWKEPWMSVGSDTYIHDVMNTFGLKNVFENQTRYPQVSLEQLQSANPEMILLSSEPYPFKDKHIIELKQYLPDANIQLIDGEWFSWYGSRMLPSFIELDKWRAKLSI